MSPERTNNVTSLPVRPDRAQRADQQAPASDFFATLLDAHADRAADRAPSRRERQPSDDATRDRRPVDRPARPDRPADVRDRATPAPAADQPAPEPTTTDEATPAEKAAAAAAASAMLGLLAAVAPQQPTPTAQAPAQPAPVVEEPTVAPQPAAQVPAVVPQPAAEGPVVDPQAAPSAVPGSKVAAEVALVPGPETAGIEGSETEVPAESAQAAVATEGAATTPVAGRASVADSANARPGDRRPEGVSGGAAEARPSAEAPVNAPATAAQSGEAGSQQSDQRQSDAPRTMQPAAPAPTAPTQRVDVTPLAPAQSAVAQSGEARGAATLAQAPRAVGQLIHLASERGVQHARLNLKPVELGGIEIRLVASSAGVTAHVVADSPEAARLLQQAGDDLRRSLADNNVELLSLDVSTSDQERRDASAASGGFEQFGETGQRGRDGLGRPQHAGAGETDTDLPTSTDQGTVIELPDGVLVDVLA
jgi:flagellar hook-length control protein FliK